MKKDETKKVIVETGSPLTNIPAEKGLKKDREIYR